MKFLFNIKYLSVLLLLLLTAISYHPTFSSVVLEQESANPLNKYIYFMVGVTLLLYSKNIIQNTSPFFKKYFRYTIVIALLGITISISGITGDYLIEARNILMALVFCLVGYNSNLNRKETVFLIYAYASAVAISISYQMIVNMGGFVISDYYLQYGKNIMGVMTASTSIALLFIALFSTNKIVKYISWGGFVALLFLTIVIRARAAFLTVFLITFFLIYKKIQTGDGTRSRAVSVFLLSVCVLLVSSLFSQSIAHIWDFIFDSFTRNQGTDLTSDRMNRNTFAIDLIFESPLFGNLSLQREYPWVHNYPLRQMSSFGLLGSIPLIGLYLYIALTVVKALFRAKISFTAIGFAVFLIPLIISLEEPTFPYAPGTGSILPFFLLGYSLSLKDKS